MKSIVILLPLAIIELIVVIPLSTNPVSSPLHRTIDLTKQSDWCGTDCADGAKVEFTSERTLVISFRASDKDSNGHIAERKTFRVISFDVDTGERRGELEWSCCSYPTTDTPQLLPVHDGGFLARAHGGEIARYSADLKRVNQATFAGSPAGYWDLQVTPGGRLAFLASGPGTREQFSQIWIDVDTLDVVAREEGLYNLHDPAAEDAVAILDWVKSAPFRRFIILKEKGKGQRTLTYDRSPGLFITDNYLLLLNKAGFSVMSRNGETLFAGELTYAGRPTLWFDRSLAGNRFGILDFSRALPMLQKREFFDWNFTARAYDMKSRGQVAEISLGTQDARMVSLALSQDGSRMAILAGSKCDIFELPPP
jgi:hypothetical protein